MINSEPNEKKNVPSAYVLGEKRVILSVICLPQKYARKVRKLKIRTTVIYVLMVRCIPSSIIVAMTKSNRAVHLKMELSRNLKAVRVSQMILNIGLPSMTTSDPPVLLIGFVFCLFI